MTDATGRWFDPEPDLTQDNIFQRPKLAWLPYGDGKWDWQRAAHLHRRAGFGGRRSDIARTVQIGLESSVQQLLSLDGAAEFERQMAPIERTLVNGNPRGLAAWWILRMLSTPCPLLEKMTLFWHGHFATSAAKVQVTRAMYDQNRTLREFALGEFEPLVQSISRDVAMLIYLDSTDNRRTRPNENYARELMELFCLGPGNYSEHDIKQVARCFTGWEVRKRKFRFNPYQHDQGRKELFGTVGEFDGDDAVRLVIEQEACGRFIARKLLRFFVTDEFEISDELAEPLAVVLRDSGFNIGVGVRKILTSRLFYDPLVIGSKIKSPVELVVGLMRYLGASTNTERLANRLEELGQLPLYPPNVKGWEGGRKWINASTMLGRVNLITDLVSSGETRIEAGSLVEWWKTQGFRDPVADLVADLVPGPRVKQVAGPLADSAESLRQPERNDIVRILSLVAMLPEFQLN